MFVVDVAGTRRRKYGQYEGGCGCKFQGNAEGSTYQSLDQYSLVLPRVARPFRPSEGAAEETGAASKAAMRV